MSHSSKRFTVRIPSAIDRRIPQRMRILQVHSKNDYIVKLIQRDIEESEQLRWMLQSTSERMGAEPSETVLGAVLSAIARGIELAGEGRASTDSDLGDYDRGCLLIASALTGSKLAG